MGSIAGLLLFGREHLLVLSLFSLVFFLGSLITIPIIVVHLPEDYFIKKHVPLKRSFSRRVLRLFFWLFKNAIGLLFVTAGIAMLFLPGQGLVTIVIGLSLLDFPGKHALQAYCVKIPSVRMTLNWIRKKYGRSALIFFEES